MYLLKVFAFGTHFVNPNSILVYDWLVQLHVPIISENYWRYPHPQGGEEEVIPGQRGALGGEESWDGRIF